MFLIQHLNTKAYKRVEVSLHEILIFTVPPKRKTILLQFLHH